MTVISRRRFVQTGSSLLLAGAIPGVLRAMPASGYELRLQNALKSARFSDTTASLLDPISPEERRALLTRALDAAKRGGATYADARLTVMICENYFTGSTGIPYVSMQATTALGVRALVKGYWGYASDPDLSLDNATRLGQQAAGAATTGALGGFRPVDLGDIPVVNNGVWKTPIEIDPFTLTFAEKLDGVDMLIEPIRRYTDGLDPRLSIECIRDERTFASSEGSWTEQTLHTIAGKLEVQMAPHWRTGVESVRVAPFHTPRGGGWEQVLDIPVRARLPQLIDEADRMRITKPIEIGRYDVVFDSQAFAQLLDVTLAPATNLYRAMGYSANEAGTSFLEEPLEMLSTTIGVPQLTLRANRSMKGGAATVRWDDEGVEAGDFTVVRDGTLADFQTTRESASWLADWYRKNDRPVRSNGCAGGASAVHITGLVTPNMVVEPGPGSATFESLVSEVERGYAILGGGSATDQQCLNGWGVGNAMFEIRNGKIGSAVAGGSFLFKTPEFMKNIKALGGSASAESYGIGLTGLFRTMRTVPVRVANLAMVGTQRRLV